MCVGSSRPFVRKRIQPLVEMVHRGIMNRSGLMELKIGHVVLLVLLCDTYAMHHVYITINFVKFWWWFGFWFSLPDTEKSDDLVSFVELLASRLVVRFSKCQKRFLLIKLKIVDTYITI